MYIVFVFLIGQEHSHLFDFELFNTRWTFPYQNYFFVYNFNLRNYINGVCKSYHPSPDSELFKELSRDRVLRRRATVPRGGSHWVACHFHLVWSAEFVDSLGNDRKRITAVSPTSTDRNSTTVRLFFFFRYAVLLQDVEDYVLLHAWVFTKIFA